MRVVGHAKNLCRLADRQTLGRHQTDSRLLKLTGINSDRGQKTSSFWQLQSCRLGVFVIRVVENFINCSVMGVRMCSQEVLFCARVDVGQRHYLLVAARAMRNSLCPT
jgi:hypothetical protein